MNVIAIVQARMGSTRLPGKVLCALGRHTALACVIKRVQRFRNIDSLVLATTTERADDAVVTEAERYGAAVFRGDENDVLSRYYLAARQTHADVIVRITADCPLIDQEVSDHTIQQFLHYRPDYASNALQRTYPRGLDTEVMTFVALERAWKSATKPYERVHVTPYLYQNADLFRLLSVKGETDYSSCRWTLDTTEDLEFLREVFGRFGGSIDFTWRDVLALLRREPELAQKNSHIRQKALHEG